MLEEKTIPNYGPEISTKETSLCLKKAHPREPLFVLRSTDLLAPELVRSWALHAKATGAPQAKVDEANRIAAAMELWPQRKYPD